MHEPGRSGEETGPTRRSPQWPSGNSRVVGVIGDPIRHSLSPLLHNAAFDALGLDWVSVAFEVPAGEAATALAGARALGIAGLSVTMPHKQDVADAVDTCTEVAARLRAVNCVTLHDGQLVGDSTDGAGFLAALARGAGFDPAGSRCVVLGAGGAARAVVLALAESGAGDVVVVNRDPTRAAAAAELAGPVGRVGDPSALADAVLVVQATPAGMAGGGELPATADPELLHEGQVVAELIYHPSVTELGRRARAAGAVVVNGLGMLVHQAALAIERWTGQPAPLEAMWRAAQVDSEVADPT